VIRSGIRSGIHDILPLSLQYHALYLWVFRVYWQKVARAYTGKMTFASTFILSLNVVTVYLKHYI